MLTDSQRKKIKFNDSHRSNDVDDFISFCQECQAAGVDSGTIISMGRMGPAAHNRAKALHRDKHAWGQYPNPSVEVAT